MRIPYYGCPLISSIQIVQWLSVSTFSGGTHVCRSRISHSGHSLHPMRQCPFDTNGCYRDSEKESGDSNSQVQAVPENKFLAPNLPSHWRITHQPRAFREAYLHDKRSPTVAFTSISSLGVICLETLRKNSRVQESLPLRNYRPITPTWPQDVCLDHISLSQVSI